MTYRVYTILDNGAPESEIELEPDDDHTLPDVCRLAACTAINLAAIPTNGVIAVEVRADFGTIMARFNVAEIKFAAAKHADYARAVFLASL